MGTAPGWRLEELATAGRENLDPDHVARYDAKEDAEPAQEVALLRRLGLRDTSLVIDIGAGTGQFAVTAAAACARVIAVDVSPVMIERLRAKVMRMGLANVEVVRAGFLTYELPGAPVDFVYSRYALHHLPDVWKAVALVRVRRLIRSPFDRDGEAHDCLARGGDRQPDARADAACGGSAGAARRAASPPSKARADPETPTRGWPGRVGAIVSAGGDEVVALVVAAARGGGASRRRRLAASSASLEVAPGEPPAPRPRRALSRSRRHGRRAQPAHTPEAPLERRRRRRDQRRSVHDVARGARERGPPRSSRAA